MTTEWKLVRKGNFGPVFHVIFGLVCAFEAKCDVKNQKNLIFPYCPNITIILNFMAPFDPVTNSTY